MINKFNIVNHDDNKEEMLLKKAAQDSNIKFFNDDEYFKSCSFKSKVQSGHFLFDLLEEIEYNLEKKNNLK